MRNRLLFLSIISLLALFTIASTSAQEAPPVPLASEVSSDGVAVTIYNQGTALVQDQRTFSLAAGLNQINFTDVAASIDPTSVSFTSLTDPVGTFVLEQNYAFDLVNSAALLERYLDEQISITTQDGTTFTGQLLSGRDGGVILLQEDGQVVVVGATNARDVRFPALPDGLITRPTLRWLVQSAAGGDQQVALTYLTGGMGWTADYTILLAEGSVALDLNGWVTLTNTSGTTYENATVKLVAGDVNRIQPEALMFEAEPTALMDAVPARAAGVEQREFFEYQLYQIARPVTVGDNETKQVEFVTGTNVPATTFFVYEAAPLFYNYGYAVTDQYLGQTGTTDVRNYLEFSTGEENGLGADLPAGRVRVYQADTDGTALLIGENRIDHTPMGETVQFYLGNAFDLVGQRIQTEYRLISDRVLQETYEIRLRNRKDDETVEIRVPEHLFRWSNWEILNASQEYTRIDSSTIEFRVRVEPGAEAILTYTVMYSWP